MNVPNVPNIHLGIYKNYQNFHPLIFYGYTRLRGVGADPRVIGLNDLVDIAGRDTFSISTFPSSLNSSVSKILSTRAKSSRLSSSSFDLLLSVPLVLEEIVDDLCIIMTTHNNDRHTGKKKRSLRNTFENSPSYDALVMLGSKKILLYRLSSPNYK